MSLTEALCFQVWQEVDQSGKDQRKADGGLAHWNALGVRHLHCSGQRPANILQHTSRRHEQLDFVLFIFPSFGSVVTAPAVNFPTAEFFKNMLQS